MPKKKQTKPILKHRNAFLVESVPPELRKRFRLACLRNEVSMKSRILAFMTEYADKHAK